MAVTEVQRALGSWDVTLKPNTPRNVLDSLGYFGHVALTAGRDNPKVAGDSLLTSARYVGVLRGITSADDSYVLSGAGMAFWLGDEDQKGSVIENLVTLTNSTFTNAVRTLLPASGAVTEGTLRSVSGTYSGTHQFQSPRQAIDYVCSTMGASWRVNGNGTLDAGLDADLFVTNPTSAVIRKGAGVDMRMRALPGVASLAEDVQDFTTRVLLLAQGATTTTATGSADILPGLNSYKDVHGNSVKLTRLVTESQTGQGNATARAQLQLNRFTGRRDALTLNSMTHDIRGDVAVGDYIWVFDPDVGLVDLNNEVVFRGQRINPVKLQVYQLTWPVEQKMGVAYRDRAGVWTDLTDYVVWESGQTNITVGSYNRALTDTGGSGSPTGFQNPATGPNTTIPNTPVFTAPFTQAVYQSTSSGITRAQAALVWAQPTNSDGSAITDGDHYEIRYRTSSVPVYPSTWSQAAGKTWSQLNTWDQPITFVAGPWQYTAVGWDNLQFLLQELTPGLPYEVQIRAVDNGTPANYSAWSASSTFQTNADTIAPATPAAPVVAASRIAIQVTHYLGAASGGTFNLAPDLHHLEIHAQYEPTFTPTDSTRLGKLLANNGMMLGQIPVVGTFPVESTAALYVKVIAVDEAGNKSGPSTAVQATAQLIDDAHISDLTVSKVTAGTITSDWIVGARIKTADTGARVELNSAGLQAYDATGTRTVDIKDADGSAVLTGKAQTGTGGYRIVQDPAYAQPGAGTFPSLVFHGGDNEAGPARINGAVLGSSSPAQVQLGLNSGATVTGANFQQTTLLLQPKLASLQYNDQADAPLGGRVQVYDTGAFIGFRNATLDARYLVDNNSQHFIRGSFGISNSDGGQSALFCGHYDVAAGAAALGIGYGATMAPYMCPTASVFDGAGTNTYAAISATSSTGFSVAYPNARAVTIYFWSFRNPS